MGQTVSTRTLLDGNGIAFGANVLDVSGVGNGPFIMMSSADLEGTKATYSASVAAGQLLAATPTDFLVITGSATKTVRIRQIVLVGTATAAGTMVATVLRRSAANTAGTSSAPTISLNDPLSAAATASVKVYSANPTGVGALVANITSAPLFFATSASSPQVMRFDFGNRGQQSLVLRGATDFIAVNFNGGTVPTTGTVFPTIEWTEDAT